MSLFVLGPAPNFPRSDQTNLVAIFTAMAGALSIRCGPWTVGCFPSISSMKTTGSRLRFIPTSVRWSLTHRSISRRRCISWKSWVPTKLGTLSTTARGSIAAAIEFWELLMKFARDFPERNQVPVPAGPERVALPPEPGDHCAGLRAVGVTERALVVIEAALRCPQLA